jgi:hypothetical protein
MFKSCLTNSKSWLPFIALRYLSRNIIKKHTNKIDTYVIIYKWSNIQLSSPHGYQQHTTMFSDIISSNSEASQFLMRG